MLASGLVVEEEEAAAPPDSPVNGKTFVVTGTLSRFSRQEAEEIIKKLGGQGGGLRERQDRLCAGRRIPRLEARQGARARRESYKRR